MTTIEEKARRVMATIEATRRQAREAGVDGADTIGADAYDVASCVLERSDVSEIQRLRAIVDILRDGLKDIGVMAYKALDVPVEDAPAAAAPAPCWCELPGPGRSIRCGGDGEYDPADPRQLVIPGSIEAARREDPGIPIEDCEAIADENYRRNIETTVPDSPSAIKASTPLPRARAEEREIPIYEWIPERIFLSSLQTAEEDTDEVVKHLERFRIENAGQSKKRWASAFRHWLHHERANAAPLTPPAASE